ncbi:MAG: transporter substrate-binding domain-containing protein [Lachnospiraceae bacterium]|nr:transporter substrate-binding domain-containing protein [Lachnospiraceae bacterium]
MILPAKAYAGEISNENRTVRVAFYENGEFQSGAEEGAVKGGYAYEYYRKIASVTGWRYEYIYGDWDFAYNALKNGEADLIAGLAYNKERESYMNYPDKPMGYEKYYIYRLAGNEEVTGEKSSLNGKKIGVLSGAMETELDKWLKDNDIDAEVVVFGDIEKRDLALKNGEIHAFLGESDGVVGDYEAVIMLKGVAFYIVTAKDRTDLLAELNRAQEQIFEESSYYIEYLQEKYFKQTAFARTLTTDEKQWLDAHPVLNVGYFNNYLPYSGTDGDGNPTGIVTDLVPELLERVGTQNNLTIKYTGYDNYSVMLQDLHNGNINVIFPASADIGFGEDKGIFQTKTLFEGKVNLVYSGEYANLELNRMAVTEQNELLCYFVKRNYPNAVLDYYNTIDDCVTAVSEGKSDATILAGLRTASLLSNAAYSNLHYVECSEQFNVAFAVSENEVVLLKLLDHCISNLDKERTLELTYQYTETMYKKSLTQLIKDNFVLINSALGVVIIAISAVLFMYIKSAKKDRKATEEIRAQYEIVNSLSRDYLNVFLIDPNKNTAEIIKLDGYVTEGMDAADHKSMPYDLTYRKYVNDRVSEEDQAMMMEALSIRSIVNNTLNEQEYVGSYRVDDKGEVHYYQFKYIRTGNETQMIAGFQNVDAVVKEQKEQEERLHKALANTSHHLKIVNALISDYEDVYEVNLAKDTSTTFKRNKVAFSIEERTVRCYSESWNSFVEKYVHPDDKEYVLQMVNIEALKEYFWNEDELHFQFRLINRNVKYLHVKYVSLDAKKTKLIVGFRSIDEEVMAEEKRRKTLADALEAAENANEAKTNFLFNMSHDIRTPMNAIMGFTDLMEKYQDDPSKREDYIRKIKQSSTILLSIINNVLEMARIEKGTIALNETAWNAEQLTDTVYSVFQDMMKTKDIEFTREISVEHNYVFCDQIKLREILINIISNAYKYTNPGGKVHMQLKEIKSDRPGYAMFRTIISDTGIGMSEEFLPHLFEEFTREHTSTENKVEGTGLGMPIVKKLLDMMGGTISVESKVGEGSIFTVTIPHRIAQKEDWVGTPEGEIEGVSFEGKRILLAEDNELNAEIAEEILTGVGFKVEHAEDGQVCVDMLTEKGEGYYDAILMDIQMPRMNGYEAAKAIRALDNRDKALIPIIAMTANAFEEDKKAAIAAGMNGHLAKPIVIKDLLSTLTRFMA